MEKLDMILNGIELLKETVGEISHDMAEMKDTIYRLGEKVEGLERKTDELGEKVGSLERKTEELGNRVESLEKKTGELGNRVEKLEHRTDELGRMVKNTELILENETNRNIRMIAEGHLDLNRKLDSALRIENEKELLVVRVNILEGEVRRIKERMQSA